MDLQKYTTNEMIDEQIDYGDSYTYGYTSLISKLTSNHISINVNDLKQKVREQVSKEDGYLYAHKKFHIVSRKNRFIKAEKDHSVELSVVSYIKAMERLRIKYYALRKKYAAMLSEPISNSKKSDYDLKLKSLSRDLSMELRSLSIKFEEQLYVFFIIGSIRESKENHERERRERDEEKEKAMKKFNERMHINK